MPGIGLRVIRTRATMRLRAPWRGLPTEDIVRAYGTAMCESSRADRIAIALGIDDTARTGKVLCGIAGKRLTYRGPATQANSQA
jgi:hypothetical protein